MERIIVQSGLACLCLLAACTVTSSPLIDIHPIEDAPRRAGDLVGYKSSAETIKLRSRARIDDCLGPDRHVQIERTPVRYSQAEEVIEQSFETSLRALAGSASADFRRKVKMILTEADVQWETVSAPSPRTVLDAIATREGSRAVDEMYRISDGGLHYVAECLVMVGGTLEVRMDRSLAVNGRAALKTLGWTFEYRDGLKEDGRDDLIVRVAPTEETPMVIKRKLLVMEDVTSWNKRSSEFAPLGVRATPMSVSYVWNWKADASVSDPRRVEVPFEKKDTSAWGSDSGKWVTGRILPPADHTLASFSFRTFTVLGKRAVEGSVVQSGNGLDYRFYLKHGPFYDRWRHHGGVTGTMLCTVPGTRVVTSDLASRGVVTAGVTEALVIPRPGADPDLPAAISVDIDVGGSVSSVTIAYPSDEPKTVSVGDYIFSLRRVSGGLRLSCSSADGTLKRDPAAL